VNGVEHKKMTQDYVDPAILGAVKKLSSTQFKYLTSDSHYFIKHVDDLSKVEVVVPLFANYRVFYKKPHDLEM
jgi:hypothetical protein